MARTALTAAEKAANKATKAAAKALAGIMEGDKVVEADVEVDAKPVKVPKAKAAKKVVDSDDAPPKVAKPKAKPKKVAESDDEGEPKKEKRTRKPSVFNSYMKIRLAEMKADDDIMRYLPTHKERFSKAAQEWSAMSDEDKEAMKERVLQEAGAIASGSGTVPAVVAKPKAAPKKAKVMPIDNDVKGKKAMSELSDESEDEEEDEKEKSDSESESE